MVVKAPVDLGGFKAWLSAWIAQVNPLTAVLVWLLILPTMVQIDYCRLSAVWNAPEWRAGSAVTLVVNWLIKPLSMALLAVGFLQYVFGDCIDAADADQYIAGIILLGIAPCTGMVFVWSRMTGGDAEFTLAQVSVNDLVLLIAFTPIAGLLLGFGGISVPWTTLAVSTSAYVIAPPSSAFWLRFL